jgi:hypothetical protein
MELNVPALIGGRLENPSGNWNHPNPGEGMADGKGFDPKSGSMM